MDGSTRLRLGLLLLVPILLLPLGAAAQDGGTIPSFDAWLQALGGPLAGAAVALILSWVVEYWPQYDALDPKWKRLVFFGLCMGMPLLAAALRALMGYVAWSFDPLFWHALWNGFGAAGVGTLAHTPKLHPLPR